MISILILTKNEQQDLPGALASVAGINGDEHDDIHVFDSGSTDRTHEIARAAGASLTIRPFDNWAAHQNWGLANIPFRYPWVFYLDADERVTTELRLSLAAAVANPHDNVAFRIQRRDFFEGTWLKHVQTSPFYMRLFRPEKMRYERLVNPLSIPDGPVGQLTGYLDHYPFSKGVGYWLDRHNKYATFEAEQILANRQANAAEGNRDFSIAAAFTERDFHRRRYHQKELFYRLPARPVLKFLVLYIGKRGFLDGRAGLRYSILQSIYEYMIVLKTGELESQARLSPAPDQTRSVR
jgi:glycosyltransferase involved in cell wall biosynthesis